MLRSIKKMFIRLLTDLLSRFNHTKYLLLSIQKCMIQPTLNNLHPSKYSQEFHYYPFAVKLDRCVGSCNTLNDLSNKVCVPNKTEDLNLSVFNMITGINESKKLTKHISCEFKRNFDEQKVIQINGGITINNDVSVKRTMYVKNIKFGILLRVAVEMENI